MAWPGTPVSLTFPGGLLDDARLLTFAKANKKKTGFHKRIWFWRLSSCGSYGAWTAAVRSLFFVSRMASKPMMESTAAALR